MKTNPLIKNNVLLILRGCSGSGKTSFADFLEFMIDDNIEICTADDYHMVDGKYCFKIENLSKAHQWCQDKARTAMKHDVKLVIVANTNCRAKDAKVYEKMAEEHEYKVVSLVVENIDGRKDIHSVPLDVLETQKKNLINSLRL